MATETQSAQAAGAAVAQPAAAEPQCRLCSGNLVYRMQRHGLLEKSLYRLFGYFPWRCNVCRKKIYLRQRFRSDEITKRYVD